jgi:Coenzyme PQQ synthesis protein D (PqqD)
MADRIMSLDQSVSQSPEVVFKELGGEAVLLNLASGIYFGLDETSTRLWQLLATHRSLRRVYDEMLAEFDVEPAQLETDLLAFVADLTARRLVLLDAPSASR